MTNTETQLSEALTAQSVAFRGAVEALLNRVTTIVTEEQLVRLKLQETLDGLRQELAGIRSELTAVRQRIDTLEARLAAIEQQVTPP